MVIEYDSEDKRFVIGIYNKENKRHYAICLDYYYNVNVYNSIIPCKIKDGLNIINKEYNNRIIEYIRNNNKWKDIYEGLFNLIKE